MEIEESSNNVLLKMRFKNLHRRKKMRAHVCARSEGGARVSTSSCRQPANALAVSRVSFLGSFPSHWQGPAGARPLQKAHAGGGWAGRPRPTRGSKPPAAGGLASCEAAPPLSLRALQAPSC